jgi:6-phosphogluconolactonase (cycloisomerase 2 family)
MLLRREFRLRNVISLVAPALLLAGCGGESDSTAAATASTAHAYVLTAGTLTTYAINPSTGGLTAEGSSSVPYFQDTQAGGYGPLATDSSGRFLYVPDSGAGGIYAYTVNPDTGALTQVPGSPFESVFAPDSIAIDASDTHLYVAGRSSVTAPINTLIAAYSIDSSGALTPIATYPLTSEHSGQCGQLSLRCWVLHQLSHGFLHCALRRADPGWIACRNGHGALHSCDRHCRFGALHGQ